MNYKILGKTGLKVSELGFGGIEISRLSEEKAIKLIREAYDRGINLFDTAHIYLNSEEIIGKALKGIRNKVVISTKSYSTRTKEFLNDLETSLKNLNTDYIDIFLFHDASISRLRELISNGVVETLVKEKKKGKVNHIGFSCHDAKVIGKYYGIEEFSVIMIPANFISTEFVQESIYNKAIKNNIGILGMKPLGGARIKDIELCFKFINQFKNIIPVVGMESIDELVQNIKYMGNKNPLSVDDKKNIKLIKYDLGKSFCRDCRYCMPCPQGINIPWINFIKTNYKRLNEDLISNNKKIEEVRKVDSCTECGECEEKCPYNLNIIEMLKENKKFYFEKITANSKY